MYYYSLGVMNLHVCTCMYGKLADRLNDALHVLDPVFTF